MEPMTMSAVALFVSFLSLFVAGVAYWRSGGEREFRALRDELRRETESLRQKQRAHSEHLSHGIRAGYEASRERIKRAQSRVAEARKEATAEVTAKLDALARSLTELGKRADDGIDRLKQELTTETQSAEESLAKAVRRLEAQVQILAVRSEMAKAERLTKKGQFRDAEALLEDAVAKTQRIQESLGGDSAADRAFVEVNDALVEAIRRVRVNFGREIDRVVTASESLVASLETGERKAA
jgi:hypothetical protein